MTLIVNCIIIGTYIYILLCSFFSCAKKKMYEKYLFFWIIYCIIMVITPFIPGTFQWLYHCSILRFIYLYIILTVINCLLFKITENISILNRKNQELAMQVSLLNEENEKILSLVKTITKDDIL